MRTAQNLDGLRHHVWAGRARGDRVGRENGNGMVKIAAWVGHKVIHSTALCHLVAGTICTLLFFGVTIFWDRSLPFAYLPAFAMPSTLHQGEGGTIRFRIGEVKKVCPGEFEQLFIDSEGMPFPLGTFPTVYQNYVGMVGEKRYFDKDWAVPLKAAPGPGFYELRPRFWCNPMKRLDPVEAPVVRVMIFVLRKSDAL